MLTDPFTGKTLEGSSGIWRTTRLAHETLTWSTIFYRLEAHSNHIGVTRGPLWVQVALTNSLSLAGSNLTMFRIWEFPKVRGTLFWGSL